MMIEGVGERKNAHRDIAVIAKTTGALTVEYLDTPVATFHQWHALLVIVLQAALAILNARAFADGAQCLAVDQGPHLLFITEAEAGKVLKVLLIYRANPGHPAIVVLVLAER